MAKRIKLQDRTGVQLLPLTRAELVQFSAITGLTLAEGASMSVQSALEALTKKANDIATAEAGNLTAINTLKDKLESFAAERDSVKTYVDTELAKKVDKVEGSSLMTSAEHDKLAGIESGAEVNIIEGIKLNNNVVTPDANRVVDLGSIATSTAVEQAATEAAKHTALTIKTSDYVKVSKSATQTAAGGDIYEIDDSSLITKIGNMDTATAAAKTAADDAQADVDALETLVGTIPSTATATTVTAYAKELADAAQAAATYDDTALAARVTANETAIATLNGDAQTTGSVDNKVAAGIASVVASAPADFDTLKEVADWIANDSTGAAAMQNAISTLNGADTVAGSVAKQVKDAKDTVEAHTINGKALSTNPVLDADDLNYTNDDSVKDALDDLYTQIGAGGSVASQIQTEIQKLDANLDASGTAAHGGTFVMSGVTEVDGKITAVDSVEVEAAGAAAAVQTAVEAHTINGKALSTNPVLDGSNINVDDTAATKETVKAAITRLTNADGNSVKSVNGQTPTNGAVTVNASQIDTVNTYKLSGDASATTHTVDAVLAEAVFFVDTTGSGTYGDTTI